MDDSSEAAGTRRRSISASKLTRWAHGFGLDVRLALRSLRSTPATTGAAVLSLMLGIGANTAIFSLLDSLAIRTLPVPRPEQLAVLTDARAAANGFTEAWSYATWSEMQARAALAGGIAAWNALRFNLSASGEIDPADGLLVSGGFFRTLGAEPMLGRALAPSDDVRGGGRDGAVAVISYAFWQQRFAGALGALGATLSIERVPFRIVGIMGPEFFGPTVGRSFDIAVPLGDEPLLRGRDSALDNRSNAWLNAIVRLGPGQSLAVVESALRGVQPQIRERSMPADWPEQAQAGFLRDPFMLVPAATGISTMRQRYLRPLTILLAIAALVLLIACGNIANLLLARVETRRHDVSVRMALGGSRWRIARQWLTESFVVAALGTAGGVLVASWLTYALMNQFSTSTDRAFLELSVDWRMLMFTIAGLLGTTIAFGTVPALRASGSSPIDALRHDSRTSGRVSGTSHALVVVQIALSLMLLVAAGLLGRTFLRLTATPLGFDAGRVLIVNVNASRSALLGDARLALYQRLVDAMGAAPGVTSASASIITPISGNNFQNPIQVIGAPPMTVRNGAFVNYVTPGWFATYGTPLLSGRDFGPSDARDAQPVAIVNDAFVQRFLASRNPLTSQVAFAGGGVVQQPMAIVGVAGDAVYRSVREGTRPTIYVPLAQASLPGPISGISLSGRSASGAPERLSHEIAAALTSVEPQLSFNFRPVADAVSASLRQERIVAMLSVLFGALAMLLAALGVFGVAAYAVSRRYREIGIRMALGSTSTGVVALVLTRMMALVGGGIAAGVLGSLWLSRFVESLLYGLDPRDPATFGGAALVLAAVAAAAAGVPAWWASQTDPATALRNE